MDPIIETTAESGEPKVMLDRSRQLSLFPPARPLVERFGVSFFRSLPECPAVYLMCGAREGVLYVGKARNLRRRLAAYRSADPARVPRKIRKLLASVSRIYWDECADEDAALARERELLKILRPRFNTVGTFSPPGRRVGWQRSGDALLLGCGDVTEGWEHRFGEFRGVQPVFAALIRLVWWALNPSRAWHDLSSRLRPDCAPSVVQCEEASSAGAMRLDDLTGRLESFWRGEASDLADWLLTFGAGRSRFEDVWRERDAAMLREFQERQFRQAAGLGSSRRGDEAEGLLGLVRHSINS